MQGGESTAPLDSNVYFGSVCSYRVTVQSENGMVSVLDVPRGVLLSVHTEAEYPRPVDRPRGFPWTFDGNIIIRMRRADEVAPGESRVSHEIMARAPLSIVLRDVTVVVEKLEDCRVRF